MTSSVSLFAMKYSFYDLFRPPLAPLLPPRLLTRQLHLNHIDLLELYYGPSL